MEISWALITNHLKCLNLLNLRNCSISQSLNRGLGEGIRRMNLGEQSYTGGISSEVFEAAELRIPLVAEESLFQVLGCNLISFTIVNKENPYSKCVLNVFHVSWFDEYLWLSTLYIVYLTCHIYMYDILFGRFSLCRWRRCIPESFEEEAEQKKLRLGSTIVNRVSLSYLLLSFLDFQVDCLEYLRVCW